MLFNDNYDLVVGTNKIYFQTSGKSENIFDILTILHHFKDIPLCN